MHTHSRTALYTLQSKSHIRNRLVLHAMPYVNVYGVLTTRRTLWNAHAGQRMKSVALSTP